MKKTIAGLALLMATLVTTSIAQARPPHRPPPSHGGNVINYPGVNGYQFLALTAPDAAIISGQAPGPIDVPHRDVMIRATQVCNFYGFRYATNYQPDNGGARAYLQPGSTWDFVPYDLVQPYYYNGRIVGVAHGFARVHCGR